jgi:hypothetical protein
MSAASLAASSYLQSVRWPSIPPMVYLYFIDQLDVANASSEVDCFIGYLVLVYCFNAKTPYTFLALGLLAHIRTANQRF